MSEKTLFQQLGIPLPAFADIRSRDELAAKAAEFGLPCILKTRRLGYDGKGQFRLRSEADVDAAWEALGAQVERTGLILEGFVAFQREVSVVAVRGRDGGFEAWPITGNWHVDGVLSASVAPAVLSDAEQQAAIGYARRVAEHLQYVGVFALELFCRDGELLANEMAPRVHNSGHWTIEGSETSQFENHLRAVLGLPLGSTRMLGHACMLNWLGEMPDPAPVLAQASGHWHDYGKQPREGRKVGHATLRDDDAVALADALDQIGLELDRQAQVAPACTRCATAEPVVPAAGRQCNDVARRCRHWRNISGGSVELLYRSHDHARLECLPQGTEGSYRRDRQALARHDQGLRHPGQRRRPDQPP